MNFLLFQVYCNDNYDVVFHKNTTLYIVLAVCLKQGLDDGLINLKHRASASEREYKLCSD
jgi:hypothetical protein